MKPYPKTAVRLAAAAALLGPAGAAFAQQFILSTAAAGNTYDVMAQQLATVCQKEVGAAIVIKRSSGSMENVDRLLNNDVSAAIVQTDVLHYRRGREDLSRIKALFALHAEEVHVIALSETRTFGGMPGIGGFPGFGGTPFNTIADLKGRKVGAWGGSLVTAMQIALRTKIDYQIVEFDGESSAMKALTVKTVDALISVGGRPQPWVQRLDRRYRLVGIADAEAAKLASPYRPAKLSYGNLGQTGVPTVSTGALLVVRDYKTPGLAALLKQTRACFTLHLAELQETPGNHGSWQGVGVDTVPDWESYAMPAMAGRSGQHGVQ